MGKKKKKKSPAAYRSANVDLEERPVVAVTVAWMLASVSSAAAGMVWAISRIMVSISTYSGAEPPPYALIPGAMWMIALITGTLGLVLMVVAYRVRKVKPPQLAFWFSLVAGIVPYIALVAGFFVR